MVLVGMAEGAGWQVQGTWGSTLVFNAMALKIS